MWDSLPHLLLVKLDKSFLEQNCYISLLWYPLPTQMWYYHIYNISMFYEIVIFFLLNVIHCIREFFGGMQSSVLLLHFLIASQLLFLLLFVFSSISSTSQTKNWEIIYLIFLVFLFLYLLIIWLWCFSNFPMRLVFPLDLAKTL